MMICIANVGGFTSEGIAPASTDVFPSSRGPHLLPLVLFLVELVSSLIGSPPKLVKLVVDIS